MSAVPIFVRMPKDLGARKRLLTALVTPLLAILLSVLLGMLLVGLSADSLQAATDAFVDGAFGSSYAVGASLNRAGDLALVGLGFIVANTARLTNIGGEGQIALGGIAAAALALYPPVNSLPFHLAIIVPLVAAMLAGAAWAATAGGLKVMAGTNEVISTLLLSFVGVWLLYWCVQSTHLLRQPMNDSGTLPQSLPIPLASQLGMVFADPSQPLHWGAVAVLPLALAVSVFQRYSSLAIRLRAVGLNDVVAYRLGIPRGRMIFGAMAFAGAFGGLAGACMLLGEQGVLKGGLSSGYGFDGLVVGLLARGSPLGVLAVALFFGFLRSGGIGMEIEAAVPSAIVVIVQGATVVLLAGAAFLESRRAS
jgi:ABC-type uncharacterized transport system permease subunit